MKDRCQEDNKLIFTIIDDTDDATLENVKPIYDFLYGKRIFITKTVWVYPPRDKHSKGDSLQKPEYLEFIKDLNRKGYEIGLHNAGSGDYKRKEILEVISNSLPKIFPRIKNESIFFAVSIYPNLYDDKYSPK